MAGDSFQLSTSRPLPAVGFGCAGLLRAPVLSQAIEAGYRLFDTAQAREWYLEGELGDAVAASNVSRSEFFLTTKLHPRDLGTDRTLAALPVSLERLKTTYLDAFLLHYPRCFGDLCTAQPGADWRASWRVFEKFYEEGTVRAIGVSNFGAGELRELLDFARVTPHLVQSWMDPLQQARTSSPCALSDCAQRRAAPRRARYASCARARASASRPTRHSAPSTARP